MSYANPNETLAVYAHAYKTADQEAADIIDGWYRKRPKDQKIVLLFTDC